MWTELISNGFGVLGKSQTKRKACSAASMPHLIHLNWVPQTGKGGGGGGLHENADGTFEPSLPDAYPK